MMNLEQKLDILAGAANTEIVGMRAGRLLRRGFKAKWVYHAAAPGGRRVRLMSLLMTNACSFSCAYCATRRDRNLVRTAVTPEELARTFHALVRADLADGLFLTSGIPGRPQVMMDRMLAAADLIRSKYRFNGYIHLKILPGCDSAQVERACQLASRVSINLEAPRDEDLQVIAPEKSLRDQILPALAQVARHREASGYRHVRAGVTTQLIAGVSQNSDRELLQISTRLVRQRQLAKTHYSTFQPVADTPLENRPPESFAREHRLYQADYLLHQYGFTMDDLPFDDQGRLALARDPKWLWAVSHPEYFPVEVLHADREALLRVPGIGPTSVDRLLAVRRSAVLRTLEDLRRLGVVVKRARGFITLHGRFFQAPIRFTQTEILFGQPGQAAAPLPCANGISPCAFR
jgi:predicted DNA-binding helix-hairpin-helix protein